MKYVGRILNEMERPIAGARVHMRGYHGVTDTRGYWCINAPKFTAEALHVELSCDKYEPTTAIYSEIRAAAGVATMKAVR